MFLAQKVFVQCEHKMKADQKNFVVGKNIEPKYFGRTKIKQQKKHENQKPTIFCFTQKHLWNIIKIQQQTIFRKH